MIQEFIEYLNIYLRPLGFETKGLASLVTTEDGQRFPAIYTSGGEHEAVNVEGNVLYHRIISGPLITREAGPTVRYDIQERTYRMRVVAFFDHDLYCLDGPYQPDIVTGNITKVIELTRVPELKEAFKLHSAQVRPTNTFIEAEAWSPEFTMPYNSSAHVAAVDYDIVLRGTVDCFNAYGCGDAPIDVLQAVIDSICPAGSGPCEDVTLQINGNAFEGIPSGDTYNLLVAGSGGAQLAVGPQLTLAPAFNAMVANDSAIQILGASSQNYTLLSNVVVGATLGVTVLSQSGTSYGTPSQTGPTSWLVTIPDYEGSYPRLLKTGQLLSYDSDSPQADDGALQIGYGNSFLVLPSANPFGNTNRFTNDIGGSVTNGSDGSTAGYMIDHFTGVGWDLTFHSGLSWQGFLTAAAARTIGAYNDFRVPNVVTAFSIQNNSLAPSSMDYAPFNLTPTSWQFITSTTDPSTTINCKTITLGGGGKVNGGIGKASTSARFCYYCRTHYS